MAEGVASGEAPPQDPGGARGSATRKKPAYVLVEQQGPRYMQGCTRQTR